MPPALFSIRRVASIPDGCFGVLLHAGVPFAVTLERTYPQFPDHPNGYQLVKIPPGRYRCLRTYFNRGQYPTYEITGVAGHSRLLFHRGNLETDSDGCVLVASKFGELKASPAVLESNAGFAEFMSRAMMAQEFELEVSGLEDPA